LDGALAKRAAQITALREELRSPFRVRASLLVFGVVLIGDVRNEADEEQ
jgi:hypothetical protein